MVNVKGNLYKSVDKLLKAESHVFFLRTCVRNDLIPKGFAVKNQHIFTEDKYLCPSGHQCKRC